VPIYSFVCECGWEEDRRCGWGADEVTCPECGRESIKLPVYRVAFKGFTPTPLHERTYHQEFKDYSEATAELEHQHARAEEQAGRKLPTPPLSTLAINKAKGLMARGVTSSEDWKAREKH